MSAVRRTLALLAILASVGCATSEPPARVEWRECDIEDAVNARGRCGRVSVFENRAARTGRKIDLNVVVIPSLGSMPAAGAVFWLEGGPGAASTQAIGPVINQYYQGLRHDHDIVFVDQRGTGRSNPLKCGDIGETPANVERYFGKLFPIDAIRACRQALEAIADLAQYTTSIAADDLDDVRAALGYERINLAGASYGTVAAQAYMRQHPEHVRSAFLIGSGTPGFRLPLPFARASQNAFELMAEDCARDSVCGSAFPKLTTEFDAVLARFSGGSLRVDMEDPVKKQRRRVTLERESFVERLRAMLYTTAGARFVPLVIHRAFLNDFVTFQSLASRFTLGGQGAARGMYFSVTCAESSPFITEQEIVAETTGTFLGDRRVRAHLAACGEWPRADVPRAFLEPVRSDAPVVMFAGDADGATPPWFAEAAVKFLPNGRVIRAAHTGHQISGACTWGLMQEFVRRPAARELDASCVDDIRRPPFATELQR